MSVAFRLALLAAGFASLAFGIAAGLARLGFGIELPAASLAALHGPLVGGAFFGTVISLERAVALARGWPWLAPPATAAAGLAWILGAPPAAGGVLLAAGGLVLLAASLDLWRRERSLHCASLALGAACLPLGGAAVALGEPSAATPAWLGFLVLTIAGERLELSRLMPPSPAARRAFAAIAAALFGACVLALFSPGAGGVLLAAALLALAAWLARNDVARRTVREKGLTRYIAWALLAGYAWLAAGALFALGGGGLRPGHPAHDAALHAWFLGFVFSMVLGHAPIIAPALLRAALPYHASFYAPLALLHGSLVLRVAGDFLAMPALRGAGAAGNAAALALFVLAMAASALARRRGPSSPRDATSATGAAGSPCRPPSSSPRPTPPA
jgi:hypothetical protein